MGNMKFATARENIAFWKHYVSVFPRRTVRISVLQKFEVLLFVLNWDASLSDNSKNVLGQIILYPGTLAISAPLLRQVNSWQL